jgi:hypothetical protein
MDSEQLLEALRSARSEASEASNHAQEVSREAGWAEQAADDAYNAIDSIIDEVTAFSSINVDQHKAIVKLSYKVSNLSGYLHSLISDSVGNNSLSDKEEDSLRNIGNILDRLFNFDYDTQVVLGFNKEFKVEYVYGTSSYTISREVKEEANNG